MRGNAEFEPTTKLADRFGRGAVVSGMIKRSLRGESIQHDFIPFTATKNNPAASPRIG